MCCGVHSEYAWIPNGLCVYVFCAGRGFVFGNSPEYKGDSVQNFKKFLLGVGLLGDSSPMRRSRLGLDRDISQNGVGNYGLVGKGDNGETARS